MMHTQARLNRQVSRLVGVSCALTIGTGEAARADCPPRSPSTSAYSCQARRGVSARRRSATAKTIIPARATCRQKCCLARRPFVRLLHQSASQGRRSVGDIPATDWQFGRLTVEGRSGNTHRAHHISFSAPGRTRCPKRALPRDRSNAARCRRRERARLGQATPESP